MNAPIAIRLCAAGILAGGLAGGALVSAQQIVLPAEPPRQFGASITAAYEGWYENADGTRSFLVGYLNRNRAQAVDVPIGPNNRIEPGGPDLGQPTHFLPGRHVGMFTITVPKDFKPDQQITWTITVNGQTTTIPFRLHLDYNVSPFKITHDRTHGNTPPQLRFEENGPAIVGPIATALRNTIARTTSLSTPLTLAMWVDDDAMYSSGTNAPMRNPPPPVTMRVSKYRGPGSVTFDKPEPVMEKLAGGNVGEPFRGRFTTSAKFGQPGDYLLHVTANDYSGDGGGGEVCCWTTALVKVSVTP